MNKLSFFLVLAFFLIANPILVYGQSKPQMVKPIIPTKRSNDCVPKPLAPQYKNRRPAAKKNKRPHKATYLSVNKKFHVNDVYDCKRQSHTYEVDTDGREWSVCNLPSWCYVTDEDKKSFRLCCRANYTHDNRQWRIFVKSDGHCVPIIITQTGKPLNIVANVNSADMQIGKLQSVITSVVSIQGASGVPCLICADVLDVHGNPIKASSDEYSGFGDTKGNIHMVQSITPLKDDKLNYDITFCIPNSAFRIYKKGKMPLQCHLYVYCERTASKVSQGTDYKLNFVAKKKKNRIVIKRK